MNSIFSNVSFLVAFSAGLLSFLSPCVLPLIPAYIGYLNSNENKISTLNKALGFVLGFSIIFVLMGTSITILGKLLILNQEFLRKLGGILIFVFGLHTIGLFKIKFLYREKRILNFNISENKFASVIMGMAFASGWTPCVGPILSSILIYASNMETISKGIFLLVCYSLGLAVPFILASVAVDSFREHIRKYTKFFPLVTIISGILMLFMGIMVFTNKLNLLSNYFNFPNLY